MKNSSAIVYITDNNYIDCTLISLKSLLVHTFGENKIYIVCNGVSDENKKRLLVADNVHLIDYDGDRLAEYSGYGYLTNTMFIKFDLPYIIEEDKCMYLDGDTIVNGDLSGLIACDMEGYYAAVVKDFWCASGNRPLSKYIDGPFGLERIFNSGVMLLNLRKMREDGISELLHQTKAMHSKEDIGDQPILNYVFGSEVFYLPIRYNVPLANIRYGRNDLYRVVSEYNRVYSTNYGSIEELVSDAIVYHFFGLNENSYTKPIVRELVRTVEESFSEWNPEEVKRLSRRGKTLIFSNVCRFTRREDFREAVKRLNIYEQDTIICLNTAPWITCFIDDIPPCRIITIHRFNRNIGGWFGAVDVERVQKRTNRISEILMLDNGGNLFTFDGYFKRSIRLENYSEGKMPTTGFFAVLFAKQAGMKNIELINFYGQNDSSTPHYTCHDWSAEEQVLSTENHVFLEPKPQKQETGSENYVDSDGFGYSRPSLKRKTTPEVLPRISNGSVIRRF